MVSYPVDQSQRKLNFLAAQWRIAKKGKTANRPPLMKTKENAQTFPNVNVQDPVQKKWDATRLEIDETITRLMTESTSTKESIKSLNEKLQVMEKDFLKADSFNAVLKHLMKSMGRMDERIDEKVSAVDVAKIFKEVLMPITDKYAKVNHRWEEERASVNTIVEAKMDSLTQMLKADIEKHLRTDAEVHARALKKFLDEKFEKVDMKVDQKVKSTEFYVRNIRESLKCEMRFLDEKLDCLLDEKLGHLHANDPDCSLQSPAKRHKNR